MYHITKNFITKNFLPRRAWRLLAVLVALVGSGTLAAHPAPSAAQPAVAQAQSGQHSVYLPLVASSGSQAAGMTSEALIAAAFKRGEIDAETALLYRVFAAFGDAQLPTKYRGDDSQVVGGPLMFEVLGRFASLKPATQATLRPFLLPPSAPGSWLELQAASQRLSSASTMPAARIAWATTCATSSHIKIWYHANVPAAADTARRICDEMEQTVWPRLTGLMGRSPLSDVNEANNGGSEKFDIYLLEQGTTSAIGYHTGRFDQQPTYIMINRNHYQREELARLFMEALLYGYKMVGVGLEISDELLWDLYATPVWAIDFVYGASNREHRYAQPYLDQASRSFVGLGGVATGGDWEQGHYLLPFYLARYGATPQVIAETWRLGEQQPHLAAMNTAIGGFVSKWPDFALYNANRGVMNLYQVDDHLLAQAKPDLDAAVTFDGAPAKRYTMPAQVEPLAAEYYHFTFSDASVRSVLFTNPFAPELGGGSPYVQVQALYQTEGNKWTIDDWTDKHFVPFCRDLIAERVTELTIIVSNSDWEGKKTLEPFQPATLDASNVACRGWQVEAQLTNTNKAPSMNVDQTSVVNTKATYELYREGDQRYHIEQYKLTSGTASWTHSGQRWSCAGSGSGSYAVADASLPTMMTVEAYNVGYLPPYTEGSRKYRAAGSRPSHAQPTNVSYSCPGGSTPETIDIAIDAWLQTDRAVSPDQWQSANADGQTLQGSFVYSTGSEGGAGTMEYRYTWKMTALPPE